MIGQGGQDQREEKRRKTVVDDAEEGGDSGEEVGSDQEEYGKRVPERRNDPRKPSEEEIKEHEVTHIPFRSWCRHCVKGQGVEEPCGRSDREDGRVPEVHLDFMFMGEEEGGEDVGHFGGSREVEESDDGNGGP